MVKVKTAAILLAALGACNSNREPEPPVATNAAMLESAIENRAHELDAMAGNAADQSAAAAIGAAVNEQATATGDVGNAAEAAVR